jgi:hypothetical protein
MLFVSTAEDPANSVGELVSAKQSLGLNYLAFAVDPLWLDCVEPRALGGQQTRHYPNPMASALDFPVMSGDPASDLMALMPACVVPDKKQGLFTPLLESVAAPTKKQRKRNSVVMELTGRPSTNLSQVSLSSGRYSP